MRTTLCVAVTILILSPIGLANPDENAPEFAGGWFIVQLVDPLPDGDAPGELARVSGRERLDREIRRANVRSIRYALERTMRAPRRPELLARWGLDRTYRFHVPQGADIEELVERFHDVPGVVFAEPDYVDAPESASPDDPRFIDQWNFDNTGQDPPGGTPGADIDGPEAWGITTGNGAVIAVVDSGLDFVHEDIAGREWTNSGEVSGNAIDDDGNGYIDDVHGWDFVNDDDDPTDDHAHGTRVSSVAAATTNNGIGMAGACWDCRVMPLKVLDAEGNGSASRFADAVIYAADAGARVINYSAGNSSPSATRLGAINYAYDAGVFLVGGAGNESIFFDMSGVVYPKARAEFIASGGTDSSDERAVPFECSGSNRGSRYGKEVDVVTPASLILGATLGGGYSYVCGNSFAGPQVAGLIGLIHQLDPSVGREEVRHLLRSGAEDQVGDPAEDVAGFDLYYGWGRTNMHRTLQATQSSISLRVEGKSATRVSLATPNPVANSYDFIRGNLSALGESARGVDLGSVVCLEDDSPDPDTLGNEDNATPAMGEGFFYLSRFDAAPGAGSYGGSSRNRDREVFGASGEDWTSESDQQNARFGTSVGSAGDVNNDGFDDVIVGAELWDGDQVDGGAAFIYLGSAPGLASTPASVLEGDQAMSSFGWSVAPAGDVNGDGHDDVIVGAPLYDNGETDEGRAYVYYGTASGVSATPDWSGEGDQAGAQYGSRVRSAGDVNDDGFDDVIVGAPLYDGTSGSPDSRTDRGRAFVYHGSASGLSPYGSPDWTGEPDQANAAYGRGVGAVGSVNCDNYDDVIVGAPQAEDGELNDDEGLLYVYHGSATGLSGSPDSILQIDVPDARLGYAAFAAGDVNGDGCGDIIAGAHTFGVGGVPKGAVYVWLGSSTGLSATPDWNYEADERFAELGIAAETVGDVNGDGYDDIIIGAHLLDAGRSDEGLALVFHGSVSGLSTGDPDWTTAGGLPAAQFGWRVAGAGDVNGDGFHDAIVGNRFFQSGEMDEGRAVVYHGSLTGLSTPPATSDCAR